MKTCEKIHFDSAKDCRKEIDRQMKTQKRPWAKRDKKASRWYKCPHCSTSEKEVWHLTSSITIIEY